MNKYLKHLTIDNIKSLLNQADEDLFEISSGTEVASFYAEVLRRPEFYNLRGIESIFLSLTASKHKFSQADLNGIFSSIIMALPKYSNENLWFEAVDFLARNSANREKSRLYFEKLRDIPGLEMQAKAAFGISVLKNTAHRFT